MFKKWWNIPGHNRTASNYVNAPFSYKPSLHSSTKKIKIKIPLVFPTKIWIIVKHIITNLKSWNNIDQILVLAISIVCTEILASAFSYFFLKPGLFLLMLHFSQRDMKWRFFKGTRKFIYIYIYIYDSSFVYKLINIKGQSWVDFFTKVYQIRMRVCVNKHDLIQFSISK